MSKELFPFPLSHPQLRQAPWRKQTTSLLAGLGGTPPSGYRGEFNIFNVDKSLSLDDNPRFISNRMRHQSRNMRNRMRSIERPENFNPWKTPEEREKTPRKPRWPPSTPLPRRLWVTQIWARSISSTPFVSKQRINSAQDEYLLPDGDLTVSVNGDDNVGEIFDDDGTIDNTPSIGEMDLTFSVQESGPIGTSAGKPFHTSKGRYKSGMSLSVKTRALKRKRSKSCSYIDLCKYGIDLAELNRPLSKKRKRSMSSIVTLVEPDNRSQTALVSPIRLWASPKSMDDLESAFASPSSPSYPKARSRSQTGASKNPAQTQSSQLRRNSMANLSTADHVFLPLIEIKYRHN